MRLLPLLVAAVSLTAAPALAEPAHGICIDPHFSYQARYLSGHDIVAKSTLGHDHRELKISTTCIFLRNANHISLSSEFNCVGQGDTVVTSTIDGERQQCRITHVEPYLPAATPEHS
jgi:hypothetical protein